MLRGNGSREEIAGQSQRLTETGQKFFNDKENDMNACARCGAELDEQNMLVHSETGEQLCAECWEADDE